MSIEGFIEHFQNIEYYSEHYEWVDDHINNFFPNAEIRVFHEFLAFDFKVHVYFIKLKDQPYNIFLTAGMSTLAMQVPEQIENKDELQFAEMMILVPKEINFDDYVVLNGKHKFEFIISMLKETARFPHHYNSWIGIGHSIAANEDFRPYDKNTKYVGGLILPSATFDDDFTEIRREGRVINLYTFFPLYKNEIEFKIESGYDALFDLIVEKNINDLFDNNRENLIKNKRFGLF